MILVLSVKMLHNFYIIQFNLLILSIILKGCIRDRLLNILYDGCIQYKQP